MINEAEVDSLFSHSLASFLSSDPPLPSEAETVELEYHTSMDVLLDRENDDAKFRVQYLFILGVEDFAHEGNKFRIRKPRRMKVLRASI